MVSPSLSHPYLDYIFNFPVIYVTQVPFGLSFEDDLKDMGFVTSVIYLRSVIF